MGPEKNQGPREYEVLSRRCVYGGPGEVVTLDITPGQELCLVQAGTLRPAKTVRPSVAVEKKG